MPENRSGDRWLSEEDVAAREGVSAKAIRARLGKGTFPAPARFTSQGALWDAADLDRFAEGTHPAFVDASGLPRKAAAEARWARLLDEVRWWVWVHGDARVPVATQGRQDTRLGPRISKVRAHYRAGAVPASVAAQFSRLPGWSWDVSHDRFTAHLDDVLTRWPTRLTSQDRAWLALQRAKFDDLPAERQASMTAVPGLMDYRGNHRVAEFTEAVQSWLSDNPGQSVADMRYSATTKVRGATVPVGRRSGYYRRRYLGKEGTQPLTASEIEQIEALPGWSWDQSGRHVSAAGKSPRNGKDVRGRRRR